MGKSEVAPARADSRWIGPIAISIAAALIGVLVWLAAPGIVGSDRAEPATAGAPAGAATGASASISMLYTLSATSGTLVAVPGSTDQFTLTLADTDKQVLWFSDQPSRHAGVLPTAGLAAEWADFGFTDSPPNVAVTLHNGSPEADTMVLEMGQPRFDAATGVLTSTVKVLGDDKQSQAAGHNLDTHLSAADSALPESFTEVSLFIDDAAGQVENGCLIQPYTVCEGADLAGVNLAGVNLTGADFLGADFTGADLTGTNLTGADLAGANFTNADLTKANLTNANISGTVFTGAITPGMMLPTSAASGFCHIAGTAMTIEPGVVAQHFSAPSGNRSGTVTLVGPAGQTLTGTYSCGHTAASFGRSSELNGAWTITITGSTGTLSTPVPGLSLSGVGLTGTITKTANGEPTWSIQSRSQLAYRGIQATGSFSATGVHNWTETITGAGGQFTDADGSTFSAASATGTVTSAGGAVFGSVAVSATGSHKMFQSIPGVWTQSATLTMAFTKKPASTASALVGLTFSLRGDSGPNHIAASGPWSPAGYALAATGTVSLRGNLVSMAGSYESAGFTDPSGTTLTTAAWSLSGSVANVPLGHGAQIASGTIGASSASHGFTGTMQVQPSSNSSTSLEVVLNYTDSTTWKLTADGHSASQSWSPPGVPSLRIDPNTIVGTISSTPAAVTWSLSAGSVQWTNLATGVSLSGAVSVSTDCPLVPASLCGTASGVFIGFSGASITFPSPVGTLPAQAAVLADGSFVLAQATPGAVTVSGPAGGSLAMSQTTVTVQKGANVASPIPGLVMPDLSASSSGLGFSFCGNFAVHIPYVGSNTNTGGCVAWTPAGIAIAQVGIAGSVPGGSATATGTGNTVSGVTVGATTFTGWAWTNLSTSPVATLNGVAVTLAKGTSELTGDMGVPAALTSALGTSGESIPALATFSDASFTAADASFTLDATVRIGVSNKGFALNSVTIHAAKSGPSLAFGLALNASYTVDGTALPVTLSLAAASHSGFTLNLTAMGTRTTAAACSPTCDGVTIALPTPNSGYAYLSNAFMGAPGAHLWAVTGQLELIHGVPGFGVGATIYQDPTAVPTLLHGTTWLKGDFYVQVSDVNPCFDFGFTSTDPNTYLQVKGGVFKTSTFSLAIAPQGCAVGPLNLPAGSTFILNTAFGSQSSIQILLAIGRDDNGLPTFTSDTAISSVTVGGIDFVNMQLDISITAARESVKFIGDFTLPTGTMNSSFDLTANTSGSIHLSGAVALTDWALASDKFDVESFTFQMEMDSSSCGTFSAATSGTMKLGLKTGLDFSGSIAINCGVLQTLNIDVLYYHNSVSSHFVIGYNSTSGMLTGEVDFTFDHTNSKKIGTYRYHRGSTIDIALKLSIDTKDPGNGTLEFSGSITGGSVNGYLECSFSASGDDSCKAHIHIHISEGSWDETASW
jgi:hypothetical protein